MVADHQGGRNQGELAGIGSPDPADEITDAVCRQHEEGLVSNIKPRKTKVETPPLVSKSRRTQRRLIEPRLQGHPLRLNAGDLPCI
jgi:hypothetical protein